KPFYLYIVKVLRNSCTKFSLKIYYFHIIYCYLFCIAWSSIGCSFEDGLCSWLQGAEDNLDWTLGSGSTGTPNTGPTGDHTTGNGKYLYLNTSSVTQKGNKAQLKSTVLPSAGELGYCFGFWYHMFGPTVGSLRVFLQTADPFEKILVWQKSGNHGDQWLLMQSHVTTEKGHQLILEATAGGEAGDVAIDDISLAAGPFQCIKLYLYSTCHGHWCYGGAAPSCGDKFYKYWRRSVLGAILTMSRPR
uniref:MAM domain-containing protein n=1 Tax=Neogobius melanostomus TaxID=47308 RepID=A0A8C6TCS7_9GOBI